jgi:monoamine oxidase
MNVTGDIQVSAAPAEKVDTIIIGAGLSGLYAARLLTEEKKPFVILEARDRVGGRILSPQYREFFSDLGPSWYWPDINPKTTRLIKALGLRGYRQYEDGLGLFQSANGAVHTVRGCPMQPTSWRLHGGMGALIAGLCRVIPEDGLRLGHPVCRIEKTGDQAMVSVGELEKEARIQFWADRVILALPPRLAAATILFEPDLPHDLTQAMMRMGTWMAGQAKFCALYDEPFWRRIGLSGQAFSERGPLSEIHDGSNDNQPPYGLNGFLGIPAVHRDREKPLIDAILDQLTVLYGKPAVRPMTVFYQDWAREPFTATGYDQPPMYEHPSYHPPDGRSSMWNGIVHFAGTETADRNGGYLEGALEAAERAVMSVTRTS